MSFLVLNRVKKGTGGAAFAPSDIAGLVGWWDFSDISTLYQDSSKTTPVASDGDPIGAVVDKSGNGNDALQTTTAAKPLYKTNQMNGKSAASFDGGDYLQTSAWTSLSQPNTISHVSNSNDAGYAVTYSGITGTDRHAWLYDVVGSPDRITLFGGLNWTPLIAHPHQVDYYATSVFNGASSTFYINGVQQATGDTGAEALTGLTIGARDDGALNIVMILPEILVVDGEIGAGDMANLHTYWSNRYGI